MEISFEECFCTEKIFGELYIDFKDTTLLKRIVSTIFSQDNIDNVKAFLKEYVNHIILNKNETQQKDIFCIISLTFCWMSFFFKRYILLDELTFLLKNENTITFEKLDEKLQNYENYSPNLKNIDFFIKNTNVKFIKEVKDNIEPNLFYNLMYPIILLCIKNHKIDILNYILFDIYGISNFKIDLVQNDVCDIFIHNDRSLFENLITFSMKIRDYDICEYLIGLVDNIFMTESFFDVLIENGNYYHPFDILKINSNIKLSNMIIDFLFNILNRVEKLVLSTNNHHFIHCFYIDILCLERENEFIELLNNYTISANNFY